MDDRGHGAVVVIGGGNMATAILGGAAEAGVLRKDRVVVVEPDPGRREAVERLGLRVAEDGPGALSAPGFDHAEILLAVKPQVFPAVVRQLTPLPGAAARVVISIMAGVSSARIRAELGGQVRVVRCMPNLPARVRRGVTAVTLGAGAAEGDDRTARLLFESIGRVVPVAEPLMDAFTAIAGSGPAYLFYLAEAMHAAAVRLGFDDATADVVVRQTLLGAAVLLDESPESAGALRAAVTSRGGTTAAALAVLDDAGVQEHVITAIRAARDRGRELSGG